MKATNHNRKKNKYETTTNKNNAVVTIHKSHVEAKATVNMTEGL